MTDHPSLEEYARALLLAKPATTAQAFIDLGRAFDEAIARERQAMLDLIDERLARCVQKVVVQPAASAEDMSKFERAMRHYSQPCTPGLSVAAADALFDRVVVPLMRVADRAQSAGGVDAAPL